MLLVAGCVMDGFAAGAGTFKMFQAKDDFGRNSLTFEGFTLM
jgi:hypothetical protein